MLERIEPHFLTKIVTAGHDEVTQLFKQGVTSSVFSEPYKEVVDYIIDYRNKYKQTPDHKMVLQRFEQLSKEILFSPKIPKAPLQSLYDEVVSRAIRIDVTAFSNDLANEYEKTHEGKALIQFMDDALRKMHSKYTTSSGRVATLSEMVPLLKEDLEKVASGQAAGIPIPFYFLYEELLGWQPAQITSVLAKTGVGKTWFVLLSAIAAASGDPYIIHQPKDVPPLTDGRKRELQTKVLIVSCEMPVLDISRRLASIYSRVSFNRLRAGKLSADEHKTYINEIESLTAPNHAGVIVGNNIRIVGPDTAGTPEQIRAQADDFDAGLVIIDGFYYMQGPGEKRWERVEANMQQMRLHTLLTDRHYMLATQFKQGSKNIHTSSTDDIAFSMSIGQDSNNVIGLFQTPVLRKANQIDITSMKVRDGTPGNPYRFNWDVRSMKFDQIGRTEELEAADDDGY
jgi:hypothetical protein